MSCDFKKKSFLRREKKSRFGKIIDFQNWKKSIKLKKWSNLKTLIFSSVKQCVGLIVNLGIPTYWLAALFERIGKFFKILLYELTAIFEKICSIFIRIIIIFFEC